MKCSSCGKFVSVDADRFIPYGSHSPTEPTPHDEVILCPKHEEEAYKDFLGYFSDGGRTGSWIKSRAEKRAAQEAGLVWTTTGRQPHYEFINELSC